MNIPVKSAPTFAKSHYWRSLFILAIATPLLVNASSQPDFRLSPVHSQEAFELRLKEAMIQRQPVIVQYARTMSSGGPQVFSTTNVQEGGVDEPDKIQFDGRFLFTFSLGQRPVRPMPLIHCKNQKNCPGTTPTKPTSAVLKLYDTQGVTIRKPLKPTYEIPLSLEEMPQGLLLTPNGFVVLIDVNQQNLNDGFLPSQSNKTRLRFYRFNGNQPPKQEADYLFDGKRVELRRVQGQIFLALSFWPQPENVHFRLTPKERRARIEPLPLRDLLPTYSTQGRTQRLITPAACLEVDSSSAIEGIQVLVQIDQSSQAIHGQCVLASDPKYYVSTEHAFFISNPSYSTQKPSKKLKVHQFDFVPNQPPHYEGSAEVEGWVRGNRPSFRLSEYQQHLRMVVDQDDNVHQLFIFSTQPKDQRLPQVATLPNPDQPTPIGKPGEQIHSVRFQGDEAYIVTFKRIDPLYKLNLSDPQRPIMEGALEIPGYSDYLQRLPNQLLLGSGYDVDEKARRTTAKIVLFDTSKPTPEPIETLQLDTRYAALSRDHHALTCLTEIPSVRCVMPIMSPQGDWLWQAFSLDTDQKTLKFNGNIAASTLKADIRPAWLRSVIHGNRWLLVAEGEVMLEEWPDAE